VAVELVEVGLAEEVQVVAALVAGEVEE